jgi:hypothetical protein
MKLHVITVGLVLLVTLQGSVAAQDWSSWTTAESNWFMLGKNIGVQYRWRAVTPAGSKECHLQLRDLRPGAAQTTVVSVRIDYQYEQAESTRDVVTIMDLQGEYVGETIVYQCVSLGNLHVTDIVRR